MSSWLIHRHREPPFPGHESSGSVVEAQQVLRCLCAVPGIKLTFHILYVFCFDSQGKKMKMLCKQRSYMYTPFPVLSKDLTSGFDPHSTIEQILKLLGEGLRDFSDVGSASRMPNFNMISSCGKGGKAPRGSVSNVRGKNQISLDVSCFLQLLGCFLLLISSQLAKSMKGPGWTGIQHKG